MVKTILVTRPLSQGQTLCKQLQSRGFVTHHIPVMMTKPLQDENAAAHIQTCFSALDKYDGIILVSLNAAEQALHWFAHYPLRATQQVFSVGKSTADFLQCSAIFENRSPVIYPSQQMDSEGLLALPALASEQVRGKRFLLLRGEGGRELIANTLAERGASVESCALYRRLIPLENTAALQACLPVVDIVLINSAESLENFLKLAGGVTTMDKTFVDKMLVVPGVRVAEAARSAGFQHIIVASNATDTAILAAISTVIAT